jgi:hypothetical protein
MGMEGAVYFMKNKKKYERKARFMEGGVVYGRRC